MEYSEKARSIIDATKVDYKRVGNSGLRVSVPILGAMGFGRSEGNPMKWVLPEEKVCFPSMMNLVSNISGLSTDYLTGAPIIEGCMGLWHQYSKLNKLSSVWRNSTSEIVGYCQ